MAVKKCFELEFAVDQSDDGAIISEPPINQYPTVAYRHVLLVQPIISRRSANQRDAAEFRSQRRTKFFLILGLSVRQ